MNTWNKPKSIPLSKEGNSLLGGTDVGKYPRHHFVRNYIVEFERNWPLKVLVCGNDEWVKGCSRFRENSNIFSLELITEGTFEFTQDGKTYTVKAGEMLVVQPGKNYKMTVDGHARKKIMTLGGYTLPAILAAGGWESLDVIRPLDQQRTAAYFDRIYQANVEQPIGYLKFCSAQAYQLLLELSDNIGTSKLPGELNQIICFLEENLSNDLTIDLICQKFGISPATVYRLFKKHLDNSPIDYLIRKKMMIAEELLESSNHSIKEIAEKLGYANQFFFSTEFKRKTGLSPRNYRQSLENRNNQKIK